MTAFLWAHLTFWGLVAALMLAALPLEPGPPENPQRMPWPFWLVLALPFVMCGWTLYLLISSKA